jgi:CheY-like chemotaxis protein
MSTVSVRMLLINCPNISLEESDTQHKIITHRAADGHSAVAHTRQTDYRLILALLPLSDLGPRDLMAYVRNDTQSQCKETSVVVIAEAKDQKLIHEGLKAGVNDYLVAPVSREKLEGILAKFGEYAKRREIRLMLKARVDMPSLDKPFFCQTVNLSRRGLLLISDRELMMGMPLDLQFSLPGDPAPIKAAGVIMREAPERREKGHAYGVHFTHLDGTSKLKIADFTRR